MDIYKSFVYTKYNSLSSELCDQIIEIHTNDITKKDGSTLSGVNKQIKDTTDLVICADGEKYKYILDILKTELNAIIPIYISSFPNIEKYANVFNRDYFIEWFIIQKYERNKGKYIFHNDSRTDYANKKSRIFTYIWYLNDLQEGGETEFVNFKIIPEKGKLVLFPACWTFPHCGNMPISDDKYIITGWVSISQI